MALPCPRFTRQASCQTRLCWCCFRLDLLLPREFKEQWSQLQQAAAHRQERARRQQLEEERRKAHRLQGLGDGRGRGSAAQAAPVYLSDDQRQNVAELLALVPEPAVASPGGVAGVRTAAGGPGTSGEAESLAKIQARLLGLGFQMQDVAAAAAACPLDYAQCLRWLLLTVPEDRLPDKLAPQASKVHVAVLHSATGASGGDPADVEPLQPPVPTSSVLGQDDLQALVRCGYSVAEAEEGAAALRSGGLEAQPLWPSLLLWFQRARLWSLDSSCSPGQQPLATRGGGTSASVAQEGGFQAGEGQWEEEANDEVMALEAIFGDAFGCAQYPGVVLTPASGGSGKEEWHRGTVRVLHLDLSALDPQLPSRFLLQVRMGAQPGPCSR